MWVVPPFPFALPLFVDVFPLGEAFRSRGRAGKGGKDGKKIYVRIG